MIEDGVGNHCFNGIFEKILVGLANDIRASCSEPLRHDLTISLTYWAFFHVWRHVLFVDVKIRAKNGVRIGQKSIF